MSFDKTVFFERIDGIILCNGFYRPKQSVLDMHRQVFCILWTVLIMNRTEDFISGLHKRPNVRRIQMDAFIPIFIYLCILATGYRFYGLSRRVLAGCVAVSSPYGSFTRRREDATRSRGT